MSSYKSVSSLALILKRLPAASSVIFNEVDCVLSLGFSRLLSSLSVAVLFVLCLLQVVLVFSRLRQSEAFLSPQEHQTSRQSPNRENDFSLCVLPSYSYSCPVERVVGGVPMFLSFLTIGRRRVAPSVRRIVELLSGRVHFQMDGFISLQGGRNLSSNL